MSDKKWFLKGQSNPFMFLSPIFLSLSEPTNASASDQLIFSASSAFLFTPSFPVSGPA